ncbi:DUF1173 family protein [Tritonibacter scottomollicae]|uniref:DUF1173 family protein n=1 Tax=Tritonibacter scottomollicae TaxID=483013 RepID=UPI003BADB385
MSFSINNTAVDPATEEGQIRLGKAHQERSRVICNCSSPAPAMYVACVNGRFILKRMPGSGPEHAPGCDSFLPPEDLSGLAQVQGNAIKEDLETGITSLRVDFSLSMGSKRPAPPPPSGKAPTEAKITPRKLGLSSLLQYLWHEADLVKWTPAMKGKRWWGPVQRALGTAAVGKTAKSRDLRDILYVPEVWKPELKAENAARRAKLLRTLQAPERGTAPLGLVVAEYKTHEATRMGARFLFKHAPDCAFFAEADLVKKFENIFAHQLMLAETLGDVHVMVIATFNVAKAGYPVLREIGMMLVTKTWIPFENLRDYELITALTETDRAFLKSQRFMLADATPIASAVLTDLASPMSLFAASPSANADEIAALREVAADGTYPAWLWIEDDLMPELPAKGAQVAEAPLIERKDA